MKYLSDLQVSRLVDLMKQVSSDSPRDSFLILLALNTGMRAQELLNLQAQDFDLGKGRVRVRTLKGGLERTLPVPRGVVPKGFEFPKLGLIFPISYQRLYQLWKMYGPRGSKFHSLRHTFAVRLLQKSKDIHLVRSALGHRSLSSTMVYLDMVRTPDEISKFKLF